MSNALPSERYIPAKEALLFDPTMIRSDVTVLHRWFGTRLRRIIAVVCAISFLAVGITHALDDANGLSTGDAAILINVSADMPDGKTAPVVPCDHCYGCTGAIAPMPYASAVIAKLAAAFVVPPESEPDAHGPSLNTPPPKATV